jgi:hypothetical protein
MKIDQLLSAPEESLAIGVLSQAVHDLRRFQNATSGMERELYLDAYRWITEDEFTWPYSFVNICKLLEVPPETFRAELLTDASAGWFGYWSRIAARFGRTFRASISSAFNRTSDRETAPLAEAPVYQFRHS